jgi:hypothetical protein
MGIQNRLYRPLAILVVVGLLTSLIPFPVWSQTLGTGVAHAASESAESSSALNETVSDIIDNLSPEVAGPLTTLQSLTAEGQPEGLLLDMGALQTSTAPPALANPISIARTQSAYVASTALSNTLFVTFTIHNNQLPANSPQLDPNATLTETLALVSTFDFAQDAHVIRNVLVSDELLPPQAAFISASPAPDRQNNSFAWNLGDIPPLTTVTLTLKLQVPPSVLDFIELDTGATAWGTLQGRPVSISASPITLAPDGFEGWLVCTIDANCQDRYVVEAVNQTGYDPAAIYAYVRSLSYEAYDGSLRGARGTLWSAAGNSVDKASLLIAMLRRAGIPSSYRHGTLDDGQAQQLLLGMFPEPQSLIGHISSDIEIADPANDPELLLTAKNHWWVQAYLPGVGWTQIDPTFPGLEIGQSAVAFPVADQLAEVPDNLRHKVTFRVKIESYDPIASINGNLPVHYPLDVTLNALELVGNPVTLKHLVNSDALAGPIFWRVFHTYIPYLELSDNLPLECS